MKTYFAPLLCCLLVSPAAAQEKTPFPPFTGERLYVAGVPDHYEPLRTDIRKLEQSSPQTYYVVVVDSTGADPNATKTYADALYKTWLKQAARTGTRLDPDRAVIVVLAVTNRQLSIHAGVKLRKEYGLDPDHLDKDIVRPVFLPYAKAQDYLKGLQALLPAIEQRVALRDKELQPAPPVKAISPPTPPVKGSDPPAPVVAQPQQQPAEARTEPTAPASGSKLPLLLGLAVALAALVLVVARLRHVWTRRRVETRFNDFRERVMDLRQRVEKVKERHQLLPTVDKNFQTPMAGATLAIFKQVDADVRRLMDDWLRRMDVWERVQGLIAAETYFRAHRLREADRLIDQLGSFDEVDKSCQGCVTNLDRLEQSHAQAQVLFKQAEERTPALRAQMNSVAGLGLATVPYENELSACATALEAGRKLLPADPLGAVAAAEDVGKRLEALGRRMDEVVRLFKRASEAQAALERVTQRTAERRAGGLRLSESDGNPDPLLEQGRTQHTGLLQALQRGEPGPAAEHLERALALAADAEKRIERQVEARTQCQRELPARRSEAQRLQQEAAQAQAQRRELEHSFAAESWRDVAEQATRAGELQAKSAAQLEEADRAAAVGVQHYLRATSLLAQVKEEQEKAHELLRGIGQALQRLTELRRVCQGRRQEVTELAHQVQNYLASHKAVVQLAARSRLKAADEHGQQARGQADVPRPDWPTVQKLLEEARQEYAAALKQAEEDVRCHRALEERLAEAEQIGARVDAFLAKHNADRREANKTYHGAVATLQRVRLEMNQRQTAWAQLLQQADEAAGELKKAEELARQDVQLAERAAAALAEASRHIEKVGTFFDEGITADMGQAQLLAEQAHQHLTSQAYEQAIAQAQAAQQAAQRAHDDAVNQARREQQQREAQRLQMETAAAVAAQSWAATNVSAGAESPAPPPAEIPVASPPPEPPAPAPPPPPAPPSESSQTSW